MDSPFSLENKTILVTGASSGIGRACAIECAKVGAKIFLSARDETRLEETRSQLSGEGHTVVSSDLSDDSGIEKLIASISEPLDGIVHCAGIHKLRPFMFAARKNVDETLRINTLAPLELTRALLKKDMVEDGSSIVFMASISGSHVVANGQVAYAASKAALCGAAKVMALELAAKKIRVNCICPGMVETPLCEALNNEERSELLKKYPLARYGSPQEIAYATIYLLSSASAWTTGSEMVIDGGYTIA
ncbi:MAG: SDR family oxidoreductase [Bacteroidales bacterium]|nr:SDR family oxidoreductase [Bacteroidales bacterium]